MQPHTQPLGKALKLSPSHPKTLTRALDATGIILCIQGSPNDRARLALCEVDKTGDDCTDGLVELLEVPLRPISPCLDRRVLPVVVPVRELEKAVQEAALLAVIKDHPIPDPVVFGRATHGTSLGVLFRY